MENITVIGTIKKKKNNWRQERQKREVSWLVLGSAKSDQLSEDLGAESEEMELEREAGTKS